MFTSLRSPYCIAIAAAFAATAATPTLVQAQSNVTLYGSIDQGINYITNQKGSASVTQSVVAVPDKWGFKGSEDLGGGLAANFQLENGFFSNTGTFSAPGIEFNRYAWVGLSSKRAGAVTLGRQWDLTNDVFTPNANGAVQYNNFLYHPGNLDNSAVTTINNSVKYVTPKFAGFFLEGMYGFNDTSTGQGRYAGAALRYASPTVNIGFVYSNTNKKSYALNSTLGYSNFLGQNLASGASFVARNTSVMGIGGTYHFAPSWYLHGMLNRTRIEAQTGSGNIYIGELGVDWMTTPFNTISLGGFDASVVGRHYATVGLADLYHLSALTMVYAEATTQFAGHDVQAVLPSLTPSSSSRQTTFRVGVQHYF